jgi:hypothetical protein
VIHGVVRRMPGQRIGLRKEDVYGAIASGMLVVFSTIPAAVPFLVIDAPRLALRVSNFLLVGLLFVVGYQWAVTPTPAAGVRASRSSARVSRSSASRSHWEAEP